MLGLTILREFQLSLAVSRKLLIAQLLAGGLLAFPWQNIKDWRLEDGTGS